MTRPARTSGVPGGAQLFQRVYTRLGCQGRPPRFSVEFYPYANLMHTIRIQQDCALRAPVRRAAFARRWWFSRPPRPSCFRASTGGARRENCWPPTGVTPLRRRTRRRINALRGARGRRVKTGPRGAIYDLAPMFTRLNRSYFGGRLHRPRLGWSARTWRTQFGCFDPALDQIVMNRWLDRAVVPRFAVEYVLFHEMLHVKHPLRAARCGIEAHSLKFRQEEKRYANYERARKFLDRLP